MTEQFEMEWGGAGISYRQGFYDAQTFLKPPAAIHQHLKAAYSRKLEIVFQPERNVPLLLKHSRLAKDLGYLDLAEKTTKQALLSEPQNCSAIARLSSILRGKVHPLRAVDALGGIMWV